MRINPRNKHLTLSYSTPTSSGTRIFRDLRLRRNQEAEEIQAGAKGIREQAIATFRADGASKLYLHLTDGEGATLLHGWQPDCTFEEAPGEALDFECSKVAGSLRIP